MSKTRAATAALLRGTQLRLLAWLVLLGLLSATALAQAASPADVHVRVVPGTPTPDSDAPLSERAATLVYPTVQYAMDHAPQPSPGGRLYVHIAPGTYTERVMVTANRPNTTFLGEPSNPSSVVITAAQNAHSAGGTFFSATTDVEAPGFEADGVTFANTAGNNGQAVAIAVRSDRAVFKHCRFLGDQDTLFADYGRQYYTLSSITGGVDFIFGNAAAVFDHVDIHELRPGFLTAQSRTAPSQNSGFVITHSSVTSNDLNGNHFYLGRPWRPFSRVIVMHSSLPASLSLLGWASWRPGELPRQAFYAEFANTGPGSATAGRASWAQQLTAAEAEQFAPSRFLQRSDTDKSGTWDPIAAAALLP